MITAMGPGGPRNGLAEPKRYRSWRGKPLPVAAAPAPRTGRKREPTKTQEAYRERLAAVARMRIHEKPGDNFPPPGVLTLAQAARELGVTERTILRYKRDLRRGWRIP